MIQLADEIIGGKRIHRGDDTAFFLSADIELLSKGADRIRKHFCGDHVDLCSIINGKSGKCSENCRFCAQSAHNCTGVSEYPFLDTETILKECLHNEERGVHRFSIVTAGKTLSDEDFEKAVEAYSTLSEKTHMMLCGSHGLLTDEQFRRLRQTGVNRYHCNIETSRRNFPNICTTHSYDDKIACIERAKNAGYEVCSGGIIGMGETWEDRIDMAISLAELGVDSIPINALMPIKGTPFEGLERLSEEDILRTVAIFRYICPTAQIRLAAGRDLMKECGKKAFLSGANSTITGDMLTTSGNDINADVSMLKTMGFDLEKVNGDE
ncbi:MULTISPECIES: biotin synthase BioB [unclassified Ruminococcus]|uniref:biotin synthase BioB n=1 Tax=unclassified Ruminococcus TaxID=2608920 RepID=UPI0015868DFE|nr:MULTISPECIES: biotin synthase BioB [unclassified Ruminococcus]